MTLKYKLTDKKEVHMQNFRPKRVVLINNMEHVEDYLGVDILSGEYLPAFDLSKLGIPSAFELLALIPEGYDPEKLDSFHALTNLKPMVEVYKRDCSLTIFDRNGRYPKEDAAIWNKDFMANISKHPEWLEPQEDPDIVVRYYMD